MKQLLSIILMVLLAVAVSGSVVNGTLASFFDTEVSEDNLMCAGTVNLELCGEYLTVENLVPSKWYYKEKLVVNAGSLDAIASVHIKNLMCFEDAPGAGIATSEPELVAEEGGQFGSSWISGLGVDICNLADFIDVKLWYDSDDDGTFELVAEGKLSEIACQKFVLGVIPGTGATDKDGAGGGWGAYSAYAIGDPVIMLPLMMGQNTRVGTVSVWTEGAYLKIKYDTSTPSGGWEMAVTHVYVGADPPDKLAPGSFPYQHDPVTPPLTTDLYEIPLAWSGSVYIAAHAEGIDKETGWAKGITRRFKIEVHFPDIPEDELGYNYFDESDPDQAKWDHWPTNAYQGDKVTFDTEFWLNGLSGSNKEKKP